MSLLIIKQIEGHSNKIKLLLQDMIHRFGYVFLFDRITNSVNIH